MSDIENGNKTEPGETVDTDVETAQQPEGSQPTEIPAAEPETVEEGAPAEPEAAVEEPATEPEAAADEPLADEPAPEQPVADAPPADEPVAEAPPAEEPVAEAPPAEEPVADEPAAEVPAAAAPAEPAPAAEPARKRSLKHVPRGERRQRTKTQREKPKTRKPIIRLEKPERERGRRQERRGVVVSDAMDKTIVVKVESTRAHQRYKKVIRRSVKFHAHDEQNQAHVGDRVRIVETKPLSKTKRWRLAEILEAAK
jgi:small subunit ribosomal protein S17